MDTACSTVVEQVYERTTIADVISDRIDHARANERPFYVADMNDIYRKHTQWLELLPRVKPFYAVKCNNLSKVVGFLAELGTGFDCASKNEIDQVLGLGVSPDRIIYANPCKTRSFIKHAEQVGVDMMTFDNELELHKIAAIHPAARLVLRIKGDDRMSRCKFNIKFGADIERCESLLRVAAELGLRVIGVSFHNGSDCGDIGAYERTIANCKRVFEMAERAGHAMYLVDIGGGMPGYDNANNVAFTALATTINRALDKHFPQFDAQTGEPTAYEIIAEPGRYYVTSAFTFVCMVLAKRIDRDETTNAESYVYYLNDGIYGAFNCVVLDMESPQPLLMPKFTAGEKLRAAARAERAAANGNGSVNGTANGAADANANGNGNGAPAANGNGSAEAAAAAAEYDDEDESTYSDSGSDGESLSDNSRAINGPDGKKVFRNCGPSSARALRREFGNRKLHQTVFWGPSCDSLDCVKRDFVFPELQIGDWIRFNNMGSYTIAIATTFNGFERAPVVVIE